MPDDLSPRPRIATDAAGTAAVDALVGRRRAELARLTLAVRTARQRAERAEAELRAGPGPGDEEPVELLATVDAMLRSALATAIAAVDAALQDGRAAMAGAEHAAAAELGGLGLPPHRLPRAGVIGGTVTVTPPPDAADLWHAAPRPAGVTRSGREAVDGGAQGGVGPRVTPTTASSRSAHPAHPSSGGAADGGERAAVYDLFWQQTPERRVRDRVRRRPPEEGA